MERPTGMMRVLCSAWVIVDFGHGGQVNLANAAFVEMKEKEVKKSNCP